MKNYINYILNEQSKNNKLILSGKLKNILNNIKSDISKDILNYNNEYNQISYIDVTDKKDYISFIQIRNIKDDPWLSSSRQELRIGKLIKKLVGKKYTLKEIENFVNQYKAIYNFNKYLNYFDIVDGSNITKYYHYRNQIPGGQLGKSCMNDSNKFISSFYEPNPDTIKMLILRDFENSELIVGRANLWYLTNPKGRIFMDRIYTNEDYLVNIFIQYAEINNIIYKSKQIYGGSVIPVINNGNKEKMIMTTYMKKLDYEYYPYVDTLQFYNKKTGEITNDISKWKLTNDNKWIALINAGGHYLTIDNDNGFKMDYLGRLVHPYFVKYSKIDDCYIHVSDAIYLAYKDDFCIPDRDIVVIDGKNYLKEDVFFDKEKNIYKLKK
jgi:hypothetical protein